MEAAVYEDIVGSLRARAWGDLDTMQEEMGREFPAVAAQSIRSILYQARSSMHLIGTIVHLAVRKLNQLSTVLLFLDAKHLYW